jgi:hypothetical protein
MVQRLRDDWHAAKGAAAQIEHQLGKTDYDTQPDLSDQLALQLDAAETVMAAAATRVCYIVTWLRDLAAMSMGPGASFQRLTTAVGIVAGLVRIANQRQPTDKVGFFVILF